MQTAASTPTPAPALIEAPYVALPADEAGATGALVWWQLSGDVRLDALAAAWAAAGLPVEALPCTPQAEVARRRAFRRQLRANLRGQEAAVVREASKALVAVEQGAAAEPVPVALATELRPDEAHPAYDVLTHTEISLWLTRRVRAADAVGLREGGGLYFVPASGLDRFRRECAALRAASGHTVHACPAAHSDDVVEAVLSGLRAEAATLLGDIEAEIAADDIGARAITSRRASVEALRAKLGRYATLLGEALPDVSERAGLLDAVLAQAALAAEVA